MKRLLLISCLAFAGCGVCDAAVLMDLQVTDPLSGSPIAGMHPGNSVDLTFNLVTTAGELVTGVDYRLSMGPVKGPNLPSITAIDRAGAPLDRVISQDADILESSAALLDPVNDLNLGAVVSNPFSSVGPGTIFLSKVTVTTPLSMSPGHYTFSLDNLAAFGPLVLDPPSFPAYDVIFESVPFQIIPEPGTVTIVAVSLLALGRRRLT